MKPVNGTFRRSKGSKCILPRRYGEIITSIELTRLLYENQHGNSERRGLGFPT